MDDWKIGEWYRVFYGGFHCEYEVLSEMLGGETSIAKFTGMEWAEKTCTHGK